LNAALVEKAYTRDSLRQGLETALKRKKMSSLETSKNEPRRSLEGGGTTQ
jgi:hypothetical protein